MSGYCATCLFILALTCLVGSACEKPLHPKIEIVTLPPSAEGGPGRTETIAGRVTDAVPGQHVVVFAKGEKWWIQPAANRPLTDIQKDSTWKTNTHMGTEYAAFLVDSKFVPPINMNALPVQEEGVVAVTVLPGQKRPTPTTRIFFSGYEWDVVEIPTDSGGVFHENKASNVWTDDKGWLHLRIAKDSNQWSCAEIRMSRSMGYGSYSITVTDGPRLEPATVMSMLTFDPLEDGDNHRELDIELSQWGDPESKWAQFTIQPYYVPANVFRFNYPKARLEHSFRWTPNRVTFETSQVMPGKPTQRISEHVFTSGVPTAGGEKVHLNLYIYGKSRTPQKESVEVVIEKFEYLP